jgi:16S rRNA (uracil1498-N3)-methyltransferase
MHRCFAPPEAWTAAAIALSAEESHHLRHVLRARPGDPATVLDGQGRVATGRIEGAAGSGRGKRDAVATVSVETVRRVEPLVPRLTLIASILKGHAFDWVVEKATELGTARIWPVLTGHGVVRLDETERVERVKRWERVAIGAAKQCGTAWLPRIEPIAPFETAARSLGEFPLAVMGSLDPRARPLREIATLTPAAPPLEAAALLIGPEGDWTAEETELALAHGARLASFGGLVLRAETAAIYGLSVLSFVHRR